VLARLRRLAAMAPSGTVRKNDLARPEHGEDA
jgi:hypothetical protein